MAEPGRDLVISVEQDRRAGLRAQASWLARTLDTLRLRPIEKSIGIPTDSVSAGWQSYGPGGGPYYRTGPRRLAQLATAYGGTNDSVTWVFSCVSTIASEAASYPYAFEDLLDRAVERPPEDLQRLLIRPNEKMTYFDFCEAVLMDLELVGNSYWLKDQRNGLGQPLEIHRLVPEATKIAVTADGREHGYVYNAPGGIMIPYDVEEVIHFRYPNPLDEHYGMGTVEAIARALDQEIAQSLHVTGFFQNGARISGILTTPDTLTETQFQRLKHQFMEEFAGAANAFKVLIAEGGTGSSGNGPDFKPITQSPNTLGVVDLRKLSKDEILTGFGVPAPLIGGILENANYKMEESQHIFLRKMIPRTTRYSERLTIDLVGLWGDIKFVVKPHANEPMSVRIEHAKEMMGAGACLDEGREAMGLPTLNTDASRAPLVDAKYITIDQLFQRPAELVPVPMPTAGTAPPTQETEEPEEETETEDPEDEAEETEQEQPSEREGEEEEDGGKRAKSWKAPALPPGYETVTRSKSSKVPDDVFEAVAEHHAHVLIKGVPIVRAGMTSFFTDQRKRVLDRLAEYGPITRRARGGRLKSEPTKAKDALTPEGLWDAEAETRALGETYLPLIDAVGGLALEEPPALTGVKIAWDLQNPYIESARDRLAEKVTRVNDTTRQAIADTVSEGMRRGYSVVQIANGVPDEKYEGILGVFDKAVHDRAETIARTETASAYNAAMTAGYADAGIELVEVMDGEDDEVCAEANGQTWTVEQAAEDDLAHPNCVRSFAPVTEPGATVSSEGESE